MNSKERVFLGLLVLFILLHLDLWGWGRIEPVLLGWIPYHIRYHGLLTLLVTFCMVWLVVWVWPRDSSKF